MMLGVPRHDANGVASPTWSYKNGHIAMAAGGPVQGPGGPVDDKIPAKLSNGEYVLPVDTVAAIGNGDHATGVAQLDKLKQATHTPADYQRLGLPNRSSFRRAYFATAAITRSTSCRCKRSTTARQRSLAKRRPRRACARTRC
jgi:hypothetical protein